MRFPLRIIAVQGSLLVGIFCLCIYAAPVSAQTAPRPLDPEKRAEIEKQLDVLEREASELDKTLAQVGSERKTLASQVKSFDIEIKRRELEIKKLDLTIKKAVFEIRGKTKTIGTLTGKISDSQKALGASILLFYAYDQENIFSTLLKNKNIAEFFDSIHNLETAKEHIEDHLSDLRGNKAVAEEQKAELTAFHKEQSDLRALQEVERQALNQKRREKDELLRLTQGKEALFQKLLQSKKRDIATLKSQLFYLEKTGITAEEAVQLAERAAERAGIRTSFLLALLEVETGRQFEDGVISVGTNLGTGNWRTDLYDCYVDLKKKSAAETEKNAFFSITARLGLNPDDMPVSRKPNYGCGGAMGHAQFLPTTWLRLEQKVQALTGHMPPSPWNAEDAFTAAAVFLADIGARSKTKAGEIAAAKTYISGSPTCTRSICKYYSNRILALSEEIDRTL